MNLKEAQMWKNKIPWYFVKEEIRQNYKFFRILSSEMNKMQDFLIFYIFTGWFSISVPCLDVLKSNVLWSKARDQKQLYRLNET